MTESTDHLLSIPEVADRLGVSERTVRRYIEDGDLEVVDVGRRRTRNRVSLSTLKAFENARKSRASDS